MLIMAMAVLQITVSPHLSDADFHTEYREVMMVASYYHPNLAGNEMANGEPFDPQDASTVAHKTLPLGTPVILCSETTGQRILAVVKDRGPYPPGRDIDVTPAAAKQLGFKREGTGIIKVLVPRT